MLRETHIINEIFAHRFRGPDPKYALVISHGIGAHGGIYDRFCEHHAAKGVDIWSYDAPGHGRSTTNRPRGQWTLAEWVDAGVMAVEHVRAETDLPVILFTYDPPITAAANKKPVLVSCGAKDPSFPPSVMKSVAEAIAGPVEFYCLEDGSHQLMLFHTEVYSRTVHDWALRQIEKL
jgi:pimeloyl-ACP methyl ester carboxylesterase